ncbi:cyclic pyranopterin phosphate synthase [Mariprofundus micogutta]|uniref:Cyclic pyranopterin monophosphate synthase n=1 Tax=Mariprofundus micogutta TaxID=1921010 RepID=A0A1L8CQG6_9PROT|nr:cyclic pyranopterin monophosphate synthase MoaC [Mariprofundus micogutta]GAV21137.1 cyclic pyranopterin phosphate synthase [Mariprofundus micogutta]
MNKLTHFDESGRARMVDVSTKEVTTRIAVASGEIMMQPETLEHIQQGKLKKGDVLAVADVAAVMGAKKTPDLIPMCHPLMLSGIDISFSELVDGNGLRVEVSVKCNGKTGVEMEALTAASTALLTIYDMCKAVDKVMVISNIRVEEKRGGKSGDWQRL